MAKRKAKKDKSNADATEGATPGGVATNADSLEAFFEGLTDVTDESDIPGAVGLVATDGSPVSESATTSFLVLHRRRWRRGRCAQVSATISDEQWNTIDRERRRHLRVRHRGGGSRLVGH